MVRKSPPVFRKREEAKAGNRAALISAATELMLAHGYHGTSVSAVAERAGLTKGAVYSIFGSKMGLFGAVLESRNERFALTTAAHVGMRVDEALGAVGRYWAAYVNHPEARASLLAGYELGLDLLRNSESTDDARAITGRMVDRFADDLVVFAEASGETLPRPPHELAVAVLGSMQGLAILHVLGTVAVDESIFVVTAQGVLR